MPISSSGGERLKRFYVEYSTRSDTTDVKRLQAELVKLQGKTERTEGKFERLGRRAGRLGNVMLGLSGALAGSAIGFGKLASRTDKFRQQMIGLVGLSPEVAGQFKAAGATIAATFGRDIDEVQSAFYSVTSAGYRSREALDIVERSAQGATAGLGTVAEVSKLLTLSLSVFKQDGLEAGDAMDKLAAGARQANFDGNALGAVLPQLGIFAKGLGVDFGETTGLMAAMSKQIGNAGEAATALQSLFRGLAAPSVQGRKALRDMGIEVQELHDLISEEGLIAGVEFLDQSIRDAVGSGAAYGETLQKVLARIESQTAFRALTSDVEGFSQIVAEVTGASGTLAESLDPVKMGTAEVMNQFKTLGVTVGEVLLPTIDRLGRRLADVQKWMAENADTVQGLAGFVFKVGIPVLGSLGVALKGVSIAARIATAGMRAFWVSTGVGAGIAALSLVIANWGKIRDGIRRAQAAVNDFFGNTRQAERFELLDELMEDVDDLESKLEGLNDTDLTLLLSSFDAVRELADAAGVSVDKMQGKLIEALDKAAELDLKEASLEWSRLHSVLSDYEETRGDFISWGGQFGGGIRLTDEAQADKEAIEAEGGYAVVQERMAELMERIRVLKGGKPVDEDFEDTTESLSAVAEAEKRVTTEAETLTGRMAELAEAFAQTGSVQPRGYMELPGFDDPYRISQKLGIDSDADWERFVREFGGDTKTEPFGRLELREMSDVQLNLGEPLNEFDEALHHSINSIDIFSDHLGKVFDVLGIGEVGKGLQTGISAVETVRGGISAGKQVKSALFGSGDKAGLLGSLGSGAAAGPLLPLVGIAGGIFAFMKIRAARRAKREKRRHQEQMRLQYETIRALNPYNRFKGVSIGSIGRYWSDRVTDDLRVGGDTGGSGKVDRSRDRDDDIGRKQDAPVIKLPDFGISDGQIDTGKPGMVDQMSDLGGRMDTGGVERSGIPERIDTGRNITNNTRTVNVTAPITVNASAGMSAQDVANQVSRQLQNTFRQAAHDIG